MSQSKQDIEGGDSSEPGLDPLATPQERHGEPAGLRTERPLPLQVAALAVWPLFEQMLASLVGFTDTALAGRLPEKAVKSTDAVGTGSYMMWLIGLLHGAVGIGAMAMIARTVGGRRWGEANLALGQATTLAAVWGCVTGLVFFTLAPWIGEMSGLTGESRRLCTLYLRIFAIGAPFRAVLFVGNGSLRGAGDFRTPFLIMLLVNGVNILVSVTLVLGPPPVGGRGLTGIAVGTALAWSIGGLLMVSTLGRGRGGIRLQSHLLPPDRGMLRRIIRIGLPNLLESGGMWLGNFAVLAVVGHLQGAAGGPFATAETSGPIGAHIITVRIESLSFLPGFALGLAASTLAGQYLGAGDPRMARRAVGVCWAYAATIMTSLGVAFMVVPDVFVWLITDEPTFAEVCPSLVTIAGWAQLGFASYIVFAGALRGAGDTRTTMLLSFGSTFLVRLPLVYVVGMVLDGGLAGVWTVLSGELLVRGALFFGRFYHGGWTRVRV